MSFFLLLWILCNSFTELSTWCFSHGTLLEIQDVQEQQMSMTSTFSWKRNAQHAEWSAWSSQVHLTIFFCVILIFPQSFSPLTSAIIKMKKSTLVGTRSNWCLKLDSKNLQCLDALSLSNHFVFFLHAFTLVSNWDCLGLHSLSTWGMNKYVIMHTLYVYQILPPPSPPP